MLELTLIEASSQLPNLVKAAIAGESVRNAINAKQWITLVTSTLYNKKMNCKAGSAKGLIYIASNFAQTPQDFQEYLE